MSTTTQTDIDTVIDNMSHIANDVRAIRALCAELEALGVETAPAIARTSDEVCELTRSLTNALRFLRRHS